jgi:pimeloyl-ACP methyl ester carboxylesterase
MSKMGGLKMERRTVIKTLGMVAPMSLLFASEVAAQSDMPTLVLVHGAWHGGWCWARTTPFLEEAGVTVTTPTLTGLGERAHLISRSVDLQTHVEDIINHIETNELSNVVLVGHSYTGFPATIAASARPDLISHLILLDAYYPASGETILDHLGPEMSKDLVAQAEADPAWNMPPLPAEAFGLSGGDAAWVNSHLTDHPYSTHVSVAEVDRDRLPSRTYVVCTNSPINAVFQRARDNVLSDQAFRVVEVDAGHDLMVDQPKLTADLLISLLT